MWTFASNSVAGTLGLKNDQSRRYDDTHNACSDDEIASNVSREEGLECPICWESFNIVENVPYVLWCGHTLCKNCVLGLQWAVVKLPNLPIQVPLFVSCPWCNLLSFRLVYKGNLKYPRKNFFLLWMVESLNGDRSKSNSGFGEHQAWPINSRIAVTSSPLNNRRLPHGHHPQQQLAAQQDYTEIINDYLSPQNLHLSLCKTLAFFAHLAAKFPLVIIFLLFVLYVVPASAAILALYHGGGCSSIILGNILCLSVFLLVSQRDTQLILYFVEAMDRSHLLLIAYANYHVQERDVYFQLLQCHVYILLGGVTFSVTFLAHNMLQNKGPWNC